MKGGRLISIFDKTEKLAAAFILILLMLFLCFITVYALHETTYISTANISGEQADIFADNIFLNLIVLIIAIASLYLFYQHCDTIDIKTFELVLMIWVFALGAGFIVSTKLAAPWYSDSFLVTHAAQRAAVDDLSQIGNYFVRFPFQLGYVLYSETLFRMMRLVFNSLPDGYYCLALQGVNLLWLMLSYHALLRTVEYCAQSLKVQKLCILLMFFCLPAVLSCTYLYGNIPAFACGCVAFWLLLAFLDKGKLRHGLLCAVFFLLAVILKLNMLIFCVAALIVWIIRLMRRFSFKSLFCLALAFFCVFAFKNAPQRIYERRCETSFGKGIPMLAWMAMGFSEGHAGSGWYKEDNTVTAFKNSDNDPTATSEKAKIVIKERMDYFASHPSEAFKFFSFKLRSQWNEPSYESIWINQIQGSYGEKKALYNIFCDRYQSFTIKLMNVYQQIIFLGAVLCTIELLRKKEICSCLLPLAVLGGILYHLLFEAKSQYSLSYFVLMLPLAAFGLGSLFNLLDNRVRTKGGRA